MQAKELIKQAFYKVNIFDPNEEILGVDIDTGLDLLNEIIAQWSSLQIYIPLTQNITLDIKSSVYEYVVSPLIMALIDGHIVSSDNTLSVLTQVFDATENTFNYPLTPGLPDSIYIEPRYQLFDITTGEPSSVIKVFPVPDADYTVTLTVKTILREVDLQDELSQVPRYYYRALKYELGMELCNDYSQAAPPIFATKYREIIDQLKAANRKDLSLVNSNPFLGWRWYTPRGFTYAG